jgi:hypothetical protein
LGKIVKRASTNIVVAAAVALSLVAGAASSIIAHDMWFVVGPGVSLCAICIVWQWRFAAWSARGFGYSVLRTSAQVGLVGAVSWLAMMFLVSLAVDAGDKFPLLVSGFTPIAFGLGVGVGGAFGFLRFRSRNRVL